MQLTNLLKALSPAFLEDLKIGSSSAVDVALSGGQLIVKPITKPIYKLSDLLAKCDTSAKKAEEDKRWIGAPRMGNEIL
ncbi:AbrB/MazE/SpoVT family DNA-binding domain-containing protein [Polynucleobacter sphagniphilus]|uniref:AbrB/MazE/SpoVT family DNA-binding domain-containing protein n=1 Tax=Polynucleobacter sphagniphilus TaxID=1743169 RepID=UPI0024771BFC|nr:hypothetical protein [Polynucleobacter sphagniphilus]